MAADRTPADALARARWDHELDPDHPWYVAWDDVPPRLRQEQVEFAEADIELLAAAGFRVVPEPDDTTRALADRLRLIANEMTYGRTASTHSEACWQWHESCALHRAADLLAAAYLDGQPQDRPATCPNPHCHDGWVLDCDECREKGLTMSQTDCSASGCRVCGGPLRGDQ